MRAQVVLRTRLFANKGGVRPGQAGARRRAAVRLRRCRLSLECIAADEGLAA